MRKSLHDNLSKGTMCVINSDLWSSNKDMIRPTTSEVNVASFSEIGIRYLKRALMKCEKRFVITNINALLLNQIVTFS